MTYKDAEVIKALCDFEANDGDLRHLRPFINDTFPAISKEQLDRCMEVAFQGPPTDPVVGARATKAINEALKASGYESIFEFLAAGGDEADALLAKLDAIARDASKKSVN